MDASGILQILIYVAVITALTPLFGGYMAKVYEGETRFLGPVERGFHAVCGVDPTREQHWTGYALSLLVFNLTGWVLLFGIQRLQGMLPLNPAGMAAVPPDLAFNTAISFMTNTNWQSYGGESTLSYPITIKPSMSPQNRGTWFRVFHPALQPKNTVVHR